MKPGIFILSLLFAVSSGCSFQDAKLARDVGCFVTTKEGRAEIRSKQAVKTDVCGDLKDD